MLRNLFTLVSVLSFLLCITASVWWIRSYWVTDRWISEMSPEGARTTLFSQRGWIKFLDRCYLDPRSKEVFSTSLIGAIGVPFVVIVVLSAILPIVWLILWRRAQ